MNKRGQIIFYGFMVGLVIIILALGLTQSVRQSSDTAMNTTGLDCTNASISDYDRITCYATDLTPFYFIGSLILIGGLIVVSRIIFS